MDTYGPEEFIKTQFSSGCVVHHTVHMVGRNTGSEAAHRATGLLGLWSAHVVKRSALSETLDGNVASTLRRFVLLTLSENALNFAPYPFDVCLDSPPDCFPTAGAGMTSVGRR